MIIPDGLNATELEKYLREQRRWPKSAVILLGKLIPITRLIVAFALRRHRVRATGLGYIPEAERALVERAGSRPTNGTRYRFMA